MEAENKCTVVYIGALIILRKNNDKKYVYVCVYVCVYVYVYDKDVLNVLVYF